MDISVKGGDRPQGSYMIYHLLPEWEVFSAYRGGAVANILANLMKFDSSIVVAGATDGDSWNLPSSRILLIPELALFAKVRGRGYLPPWVVGSILRDAFAPVLSRLKKNDIVWCHAQPSLCAALYRPIRAKGAFLIYHAHSSLAPFPLRSKFKFFRADTVIFVSEAMRQEALSLVPSLADTHAIANGADEATFHPAARRECRGEDAAEILYVGRLHPEKGVHVLMEALTLLERRGVTFRCRVLGSSFTGGSRPTAYSRRLTRIAPGNVTFGGYVRADKLAEAYRSSDIVCCPSLYQEPFGSVNIEAMACAIPVVASRVGGIPEIASEGGILLVEPGCATQLAAALQRLVEDEELRAKLGQVGLQSFQRRFTWERVYEQYRHVIDSLMEKPIADGSCR